MNIFIFILLHLYHIVLFYLWLLPQYEYFYKFNEIYVSEIYYTCSMLTFLFLLLNGIVLICGMGTKLLKQVLGATGIFICIINSVVYIKLRTEYITNNRSSALVVYGTSPAYKEKIFDVSVLRYIENAIILGALLFIVSTVIVVTSLYISE